MSRGHLIFITNMFQGIMICVEHKFLMKQIMPPMLDSLDDGIEFYVISTVSETSTRGFFTKEGNGTIVLTEHCTNPCL